MLKALIFRARTREIFSDPEGFGCSSALACSRRSLTVSGKEYREVTGWFMMMSYAGRGRVWPARAVVFADGFPRKRKLGGDEGDYLHEFTCLGHKF